MTELEMTSLLLKLADLGVTGIKVHYEGGGDSGAIENVVYTTKENAEFDDIDYINSWDKDQALRSLNSDLCNTIENFAIDQILEDIEDWWNNEGGYGVLLIKVPSGEYLIHNNIRRVELDEYDHDGNLFKKTK